MIYCLIAILQGSSELLATNGKLSVIMPYAESCLFIAEAAKYGLSCIRKTNVKTRANYPIKRLLLEFSKKPVQCIEDFLIIGREHNLFSEPYKKLTRDFYLAF